MGATNNDVQAGPTRLAKLVAPSSDERVQLFELDAHGQLRSLEGVRGQRADLFMKSLEVHDAFRENAVDESAMVTVGVVDALFAAACASRICARFS